VGGRLQGLKREALFYTICKLGLPGDDAGVSTPNASSVLDKMIFSASGWTVLHIR
jgi:hypothetical protein